VISRIRRRLRDERGVATIELAFALPVLVVFIYGIFVIGQLMAANAGMQNALGQGARYATLCLNPSTASGCSLPTDADIQTKITSGLFGTGSGTWSTPTIDRHDASHYLTIQVSYSQKLNFLLVPGPTVTLTRSKKVYTAVLGS
jgi:Flp pilus assembly protein TadG